MSEISAIKTATAENLLEQTSAYHKGGWRLVQISATRLSEAVELSYSFDKENRLEHLRVTLPATDARVPSISSLYWCAFLYENEVHDLFNVQVDGIAVDFKGSLYRTAVKFPFGSTKPPAVKSSSSPTTPASQPAPDSGNSQPLLSPAIPPGATGSPATAQPPAQMN